MHGVERLTLKDERQAPPVHDCAYIAKRNKMVPNAEALASAAYSDKSSLEWSQAFFHWMDVLMGKHDKEA
jgi:hypothetical protein